MTREEAKEVFLNRGFIDGIYDGDKWREACIVISKWLEQEPTTKNDLGVENDLVSSIVEKISEKVTETREEFIFETIRPYCENVVQMKISKRDLEQALLKYYGKNDLGVEYISRADINQVIEDYMDEQYHALSDRTRERAFGANAVKARINELSSATPIRPKGHWIIQPSNKEQGERDFIWWKCSECGQVIFSETLHDRLEFHAFCGRCGAKMVEPQERSEKE